MAGGTCSGGDAQLAEGLVVPNLIVTRLGGLDRSWRAALATVWFSGMLAALAWLLRRLQARHLI